MSDRIQPLLSMPDRLLLLQLAEQIQQRKSKSRMLSAIGHGGGQLRDALMEDVCQILLSAEPSVNPLDLQDEAKRLVLIRRLMCGLAWNEDTPTMAVDFSAARFRAMAAALTCLLDEWLTVALEIPR